MKINITGVIYHEPNNSRSKFKNAKRGDIKIIPNIVGVPKQLINKFVQHSSGCIRAFVYDGIRWRNLKFEDLSSRDLKFNGDYFNKVTHMKFFCRGLKNKSAVATIRGYIV